MSIKSHLPKTPSDAPVTAGRPGERSTKPLESNGGFIDAISVCNCHLVRKSNSTTSSQSLEYQAKINLSGNLPDASLYTKQAGKLSANRVTRIKLNEKMENVAVCPQGHGVVGYAGEFCNQCAKEGYYDDKELYSYNEGKMTRLFAAKEGVVEENREKERKYVVLAPYNDVAITLAELFGAAVDRGESQDTFWEAPGVDFVRLRENTQELTIKRTDQDTIEDRLEINLKANYTLAMQWANAVFGAPKGSLTKRYAVYQVGSTHISVYIVKGDSRVFLEIEGANSDTIQSFENMLRSKFTFNQVMQSLYQLFLGDK